MHKSFFGRLDELDLLIAAGPDLSRFQRKIKPLLKEEASQSYFYEHLHEPEWLSVLFTAGCFENAPPPKRDRKAGTVTFPVWPALRFLVRMANLAKQQDSAELQELVLKVVRSIPHTDNITIYDDLADIALLFPAKDAVQFVWDVERWLKPPRYRGRLPRKLVGLIVYLAEHNEPSVAIRMARVLFGVYPDDKYYRQQSKRNRFIRPEPKTYLDVWEYDQYLQQCIPILVRSSKLTVVWALCELLDNAIRYSNRDLGQRGPEDYSYIWRPAIEDHGQNLERDVKHPLVKAIRSAGELLLHSEQGTVDALIAGLESRSWFIFTRLALHLLRVAEPPRLDVIARYLSNRAYFDEVSVRHEYSLLLRSTFSQIDVQSQAEILRLIDGGPELEFFKQRVKDIHGRAPTEHELSTYVDQWKVTWLEFIKESLDPTWSRRYEEMCAHVKPSDHAEFPSYISISGETRGVITPLTLAEMQAKQPKELAQFLRDWTKPEDPDGLSEWGIANLLTQVIASRADHFSKAAEEFHLAKPTYMSGIIEGFAEASRKQTVFEWQPVLDLALWAAVQFNGAGLVPDQDPNRKAARQSIAKLVSVGLEKDHYEIPFTQRDRVWQMLATLSSDVDPTSERESELLNFPMEAPTLSVNSVRGEAMHAVFRYGLWVRSNFERINSKFTGMANIPEVAELLLRHLDVQQDRSLAVRSAYGQWFPWLTLLDNRWAAEHVEKIFPADPGETAFWSAAWAAYIVFCPPYDSVLPILRRQYVRAVSQLADQRSAKPSYADLQVRLAEHLMVFYWRGKLGLQTADELLRGFFEVATVGLRTHALDFVGRSLGNTSDPIEAQILNRLLSLWQWRLESLSAVPEQAQEIEAFGWWFVSDKFPDEVAIENLRSSLLLFRNVEPSDAVMAKLNRLSQAFPSIAAECVSLMASGEKELWKIEMWRSDALAIVEHAIRSNDDLAKNLGRNAANKLGQLGFLEFRQVAK